MPCSCLERVIRSLFEFRIRDYHDGTWNGRMSKVSKTYRDKAASELRDSRKRYGTVDRPKSVKRAAAYKELAHNEEWLAGEPLRSKKRRKRR